jgi:hypothetical protein
MLFREGQSEESGLTSAGGHRRHAATGERDPVFEFAPRRFLPPKIFAAEAVMMTNFIDR